MLCFQLLLVGVKAEVGTLIGSDATSTTKRLPQAHATEAKEHSTREHSPSSNPMHTKRLRQAHAPEAKEHSAREHTPSSKPNTSTPIHTKRLKQAHAPETEEHSAREHSPSSKPIHTKRLPQQSTPCEARRLGWCHFSFLAWHKSGTFFGHSLIRKLQERCGRPWNQSHYTPVLLGNTCSITMSHAASPITIPSWLRSSYRVHRAAAMRLRDIYQRSADQSIRIVYMLRDPFKLVVSLYNYHAAGNECTGRFTLTAVRELCRGLDALRQEETKGLFLAANFSFAMSIDHMVRTHRLLSSMPQHALAVRMEFFASSFSSAMRELLRFIGLAEPALEIKMRGLDTASAHFSGQVRHLSSKSQSKQHRQEAILTSTPCQLHDMLAASAQELGYSGYGAKTKS